MKYSTKAMFGKINLGDICDYDYINWAEEMLMADYDSPSLRILAGLNPDHSFWDEEAEYFWRSIKELDIEMPRIEDGIKAYACEIAQKIINDQFTLSKSHLTSSQLGVMALSNIYYKFLDDDLSGNYSDYAIWFELDDTLCSLLGGFQVSVTLENFDPLVKQEAEIFLAKMASYNQANDSTLPL